MSNSLIIIGLVAYVVIAYVGALGLTYYNEKNSDYTLEPKVLLFWPIVLALVILTGPFYLAEQAGIKARVKRMDAEFKALREKACDS